MSLVRAIEVCDAYRGPGAGVRVGTSRVRWAIESAVAAVFEVGIEELRAPTRGSARAAFARQVAMYLAHVGCGEPDRGRAAFRAGPHHRRSCLRSDRGQT